MYIGNVFLYIFISKYFLKYFFKYVFPFRLQIRSPDRRSPLHQFYGSNERNLNKANLIKSEYMSFTQMFKRLFLNAAFEISLEIVVTV